MKRLELLLEGLEYQLLQGNCQIQVKGLAYDSRKVVPGGIFVCIRGYRQDGHSYMQQAVDAGARVLVIQRDTTPNPLERPLGAPGKLLQSTPEELTIIQLEDTRLALAKMSAAWFDHPSRSLTLIGVTGTKGKTSTAYMIARVLEQAGHKTGLMGTVEIHIGDKVVTALNTTPESYEIQEYLQSMAEAGCTHVVMEVSSQGLKLQRTAGLLFAVGIYTNLTADHIGPGEHESFQEYLACKSQLFRQCQVGIVNGDDPNCQQILQGHTCKVYTYGLNRRYDFWGEKLELEQGSGWLGVCYEFGPAEPCVIHLRLPGAFNVSNSLAAAALGIYCGCTKKQITQALIQVQIPGRCEQVPVSGEYTLLIDYAHNAMSLRSLLTTLREYNPRRLICLFGCGGNRSGLRRGQMGQTAGELADLTVITSDNPRMEDPMEIIAQIRQGIDKTTGRYVIVPDRREAIASVLREAQPGDVIVLAGKGHEQYQEIKGIRYPMDERLVVREALAKIDK